MTRRTEEPVDGSSRRDQLWALGLFAGAALLRFAHLLTIAKSPFFTHLSLDPLAYHEWGMRIASGEWIGTRIFYQDPLYPYFLGIVYSIVGQSPLVAVAIQLVLGASVAPLLFYASRSSLGRSTAIVTGVLAATYAPSIYYDGLLLKTWMESFLVAAVVWALARAIVTGRRSSWVLTGFLLGLGCLVRANLLLILGVLAIWTAVDRSARATVDPPAPRAELRRPTISARFAPALALGLGAGLVLGVVLLRNRTVGGEWVLTTSQGGQNFYLGNNPLNEDGEYSVLPFVRSNPKYEEIDFAREAQRRTGRSMRPSEISSFWFSEGFAWIRSKPLDWMHLTLRKVRVYWNAYEVPDNLDYYESVKVAPVLRLPLPGFGLVAPLGLVGGVLLWRRRGWVRAVLLCLLVYSASVVFFFVFARYRMAMMPLLFPLAAAAVTEAVRRAKAASAPGGKVRLAWIASGLFLALACVNLPVRATADSWRYRIASNLRLPTELATTATAHFNLGVTYAKEAQASEAPQELLRLAESELREALRQERRFGKMYVELGKVLARLGRTDEAIGVYLDAVRVEPNLWQTHHSLGILYRKKGDRSNAERSFRRAMEVEAREPDSPVELGRILLEEGRRDEAADMFRRALALAPENAAARKGLAEASP